MFYYKAIKFDTALFKNEFEVFFKEELKKRPTCETYIMAYVYAMIVDASYRSNGIGKSILEKAFDIAKLSGCKKIELDSGFPREEAHKFYERIGFEKRAYLFSKDL